MESTFRVGDFLTRGFQVLLCLSPGGLLCSEQPDYTLAFSSTRFADFKLHIYFQAPVTSKTSARATASAMLSISRSGTASTTRTTRRSSDLCSRRLWTGTVPDPFILCFLILSPTGSRIAKHSTLSFLLSPRVILSQVRPRRNRAAMWRRFALRRPAGLLQHVRWLLAFNLSCIDVLVAIICGTTVPHCPRRG